MNKLLPAAAAALATIAAASAAMAATQLGEHVSFSGFGTLGAVQTNSDEGKFGRDRQVGGADKQAGFDVDSNLGLQLTGVATSWLSGTVQALSAKRDKDHIDTDVEWAFVTVKPIDGLTLRGGKMAAPVFAVSDSRSVGYANTWLRAPNEVYALNPFRNLKGADATYRQTMGPVSLSVTGFGGTTSFEALPTVEAKGDDLKGVTLLLETEWATFRLVRMTTKVSIPAFRVSGSLYTFTGYGVTVDRDDIVAQAEFVKRQSDQNPQGTDASGWYVMGGYRFGKWLPYAIVSSTKPKYPNFAALVSATQKSTALGVRWDAFSSAAIKLQLDRIDTNGSKGISFTTPATPPAAPGAPPGTGKVTKPVTALSVAVDFTF